MKPTAPEWQVMEIWHSYRILLWNERRGYETFTCLLELFVKNNHPLRSKHHYQRSYFINIHEELFKSLSLPALQKYLCCLPIHALNWSHYAEPWLDQGKWTKRKRLLQVISSLVQDAGAILHSTASSPTNINMEGQGTKRCQGPSNNQAMSTG